MELDYTLWNFTVLEWYNSQGYYIERENTPLLSDLIFLREEYQPGCIQW